MAAMKTLSRWDDIKLAEKATVEARVLSGIGELVERAGYQARIKTFKLECPHPWAIAMELVIDWDDPKQGPHWLPASSLVTLIARFDFRELTKLSAFSAHADTARLDNARLRDVSEAVAEYARNIAATIEKEEKERQDAQQATPPHAPTPTPTVPDAKAAATSTPTPTHSDAVRADLLSAMTALGFPKKEAQQRTDRALSQAAPGTDTASLVTLALKRESAT